MEDKTALSVAVDYNPVSRSYGTFTISMLPVEKITTEQAVELLNKAWDEALVEINAEEIEKVKQKISSGLVYLRDNPEDAAYIVGSMAVSGMKLDEIEAQEQKIDAVNYKKVRDVAKKLINQSPQILGILKPKGDNND